MFDWKILYEVVESVKDLTKAIREATAVYKAGLEQSKKEKKDDINRFY